MAFGILAQSRKVAKKKDTLCDLAALRETILQ
jgi:hypothetical protein